MPRKSILKQLFPFFSTIKDPADLDGAEEKAARQGQDPTISEREYQRLGEEVLEKFSKQESALEDWKKYMLQVQSSQEQSYRDRYLAQVQSNQPGIQAATGTDSTAAGYPSMATTGGSMWQQAQQARQYQGIPKIDWRETPAWRRLFEWLREELPRRGYEETPLVERHLTYEPPEKVPSPYQQQITMGLHSSTVDLVICYVSTQGTWGHVQKHRCGGGAAWEECVTIREYVEDNLPVVELGWDDDE